jgi:hypothetical protein
MPRPGDSAAPYSDLFVSRSAMADRNHRKGDAQGCEICTPVLQGAVFRVRTPTRVWFFCPWGRREERVSQRVA